MTAALYAGLELMVIGMGIVFIFLISLIMIANAMSKLVQKLYPEPIAVAVSNTTTAATGSPDESVTAAISAAVHRYRSQK